MQIREKGKKILCIRTEYKPELKRTVGVTVASFDKWLSTAPESVCQQLTKEEVDQLSKWLSERTENQSVDSLKGSLSTVSFSAGRAAKALSVESLVSGLSTEEADKIWLSLGELSKALRKAGFKKPKQTEKKSVGDSQTGQLPLDE